MARSKTGTHVVPQIAFNAGEVSAYLRGRIDLQKFQQGAAELTNFMVLPQGPITRRAGTKYQSVLPAVPGGDIPTNPWGDYGEYYYEWENTLEWIPVWNFVMVENSFSSAGNDDTPKSWWAAGANYQTDDSLWPEKKIWGAAVHASQSYWYGGGPLGQYFTYDLRQTLSVGGIRIFTVNGANVAGHIPHTITVYTAPELKGVDHTWEYDESALNWTATKVYTSAQYAVNQSNIEYTIPFDSEVECRYVRVKTTDMWNNYGSTEQVFQSDRIEINCRPLTGGYPSLWHARKDLIYKEYDDLDALGWTATCNSGQTPDFGVNNYFTQMIDNNHTSQYTSSTGTEAAPVVVEIEDPTGVGLHFSKINIVSSNVASVDLPENIKFFLTRTDDTVIDGGTWWFQNTDRQKYGIVSMTVGGYPKYFFAVPAGRYKKITIHGWGSNVFNLRDFELYNEYLIDTEDPNA